ncbi:unnamed protein product [Nyctereutes procyonoides]|uniref:(raccoon dog) hypothetical protein n=1 Tax=Nyctereutes procyonoides TaxID=34880 RepID=A0A811YEC7_NYCPR|nr:unnamed protein product [Nyctereutes procyonoides]
MVLSYLPGLHKIQRPGEGEAETQAEGEAGSLHREADVGFDPGSPGSRPGPKAGAKPLRHPGIPVFFLSIFDGLIKINFWNACVNAKPLQNNVLYPSLPSFLGEARTAPPKPGTAKKKAPKKGSQTKNQEARVSEARKVSQQPDKATRALPRATGPSGKSKVKGRRKAKGKNGAASPAKKENHVPKEVVAHVAKEGPKAKVAAPPNGGRSKTLPEYLARKTEAPRGPRRAGMPTKASSSKLASRKAETES